MNLWFRPRNRIARQAAACAFVTCRPKERGRSPIARMLSLQNACAVLLAVFVAPWLSGCGSNLRIGPVMLLGPATTFEKHRERALARDAESQNLLGFMLFFGEGVARNRVAARDWFEMAAAQGNAKARRNLAALDAVIAHRHSPARTARAMGAAVPPEAGEETYVTFCAGCHGLNGIAAYVGSPSFALGERLDKGETILLHTLANGKGSMPGWYMLPKEELINVLRFLLKLKQRYEAGIDQVLRTAPRKYFRFGVMSNNDAAFRRREELGP